MMPATTRFSPKTPHHYAELKPAVFNAISPSVVIFSTSNKSQPHDSYCATMRRAGAEWYITSKNRDGEVLMITDGETLKFETEF